jgi:hypothetical protein
VQLIAFTGDDQGAQATADSLATATGASVTSVADDSADLLVIASRPEVEQGQVGLSAAAENLIEGVARCPVFVVPRGRELTFARGAERELAPSGVPSVA